VFLMTAPGSALSLKRELRSRGGKQPYGIRPKNKPQAAPDTPTHHHFMPTPSLTRPGLASCLRWQAEPFVDAS
jgi:hypothetical protein